MRFVSTLAVFYVTLCSLAWAAEEPDYFPMQVGNSWIFEKYDVEPRERGGDYLNIDSTRSRGTCSIQVVGTTVIADTTYFVVVTQNGYVSILDTLYTRKEEQKVMWRFLGREWLAYDFAAPQGSFWEILLPEGRPHNEPPLRVRANVLLSDGGFDDGIGTDPNKRYFGFEPPGIEGAWYEVYLADIGPVFVERYPTEMEDWDIARLKEAHVSGRVIRGDGDTITSVSMTSFGQLKNSFRTGR